MNSRRDVASVIFRFQKLVILPSLQFFMIFWICIKTPLKVNILEMINWGKGSLEAFHRKLQDFDCGTLGNIWPPFEL